MTILFPSPVFGPVHSRRLGLSLGINLLPADGKVCNFDCIYCECGLRQDFPAHQKFPTRQEVREALHRKLTDMSRDHMLPDVITFAGNGEPTLHPDFPGIIDDTLALRDRFCPEAKVSVLSNATRIVDDGVFEALRRVDNNILKLDTVDIGYIRRVDRPASNGFDLQPIVERMAKYKGQCIIQTMFLEGEYDGRDVSNTGDHYVLPWLDTVRQVRPASVMIYTIERETPVATLRKATHSQLDRIAALVVHSGISCQVSY